MAGAETASRVPRCRRDPAVANRIQVPEFSGPFAEGGPMAEKSGKVAQAYEAEAEAMRVKRAKLRTQRLARGAEEAAARPAAAATKGVAKGAGRKKSAAKQP